MPGYEGENSAPQEKSHKKIIIIVAAVVVLAVGVLVGFVCVNRVDYPYTQEYVPGQGNIKGSVNVKEFTDKDPRFAIGANADGYAVFKNPDKAYDALVEEYSDAIEHIQEEFSLDPLSKNDFIGYGELGWQASDFPKGIKEKCEFVSDFFDVYDNSFSEDSLVRQYHGS